MTDLRKAAEMALEALENIDRWLPTIGQRGLRDYEADAIQALRQALAQPEQETKRDGDSEFLAGVEWAAKAIESKLPKREWVGLTYEEKSELVHKYKHIETGWLHDADLIAETEAKLKEKNT